MSEARMAANADVEKTERGIYQMKLQKDKVVRKSGIKRQTGVAH